MIQPIPVSPETLAGKTWRKSSSYLFASSNIVCPIDYTEVSSASVNMPLAFIKSGETYRLVAVHGLLQDMNLYVDAEGRWLADYVPLEYRLYPFLLAQVEDGRSVLCIDESSGLLTDDEQGLPFFENDKPTELLSNIMNALSTRQAQRLRTDQIVQQLAEAGLLKNWELEFQLDDEPKRVEGLHCIDENAIASLDGDQLVALRNSGALPLIYCQMLSMHQLQYLLKLLKKRLAIKAQKVPVRELNLDGITSDSGTLSFDNL